MKMLLTVLMAAVVVGCAKPRDGANGSDGLTGLPGQNAPPTAFTPVKLVLPCAVDPENPTAAELNNPNYEVLIRMANNTLLASYSSGTSALGTHLSLVPPGNYTSTANVACNFTVTADLEVVR